MRGKLHHIEIYVSNLEKSRVFWSWLLEKLGYTLFQEWESGFSYILDDTYIVFVQTEERFKDVSYHRCRTGLNHLAFHVQDSKEVDEFTEVLRTKNIPILYEDRHPYAGGEDTYIVFFEDPDRIKVELVAET
jgi:catechol 2,3-dioxygenase-like lactoylglutathione lyase family enzyme